MVTDGRRHTRLLKDFGSAHIRRPMTQTAPTNGSPRRSRTRPKPLDAVVDRVRRLSPSMVSVTLGGEDFAGFTWPGPASHLKVVLPSADGQATNGPVARGNGQDLPERVPRGIRRTYTPRRFDPVSGTLDIEFVLHGDGPAARWAEAAAPGDRVGVTQPRRGYTFDPSASWLLLAGDESALPAIGTLLDARPTQLVVTVLVEVAGPADEIAMRESDGVQVQWVHRGTDRVPGAALEEAIATWHRPSGAGRVFAACEAVSVRRIRRHLMEDRHFAPAEILTSGYWRLGESNHPDNDHGEDAGM